MPSNPPTLLRRLSTGLHPAHLLFPVTFAAVSRNSPGGLHEAATPHATVLGRNDQMTFWAWTGHPVKS